MANSDLPGYAPERPLWQPPAVIPSGSVGELARAVQTALAGISGALQQLGGRRNVVPLQGDLDARDGQVIAGVASGQVITLPSPNLGQFGSVTVILTAVSSAATVVSPDGSSYELDQTGVYEFAISPDDTTWRAPPWLDEDGAGFDWATTLGKGRTSGAHSPVIDAGQYLGFGDPAVTDPFPGQIRADGGLELRCTGAGEWTAVTSLTFTALTSMELFASTGTLHLRPTSYCWVNPFGQFYVYTANVARLEIGTNGTWYLGASFDSGTSGQVITSQGNGSPPIWSTVDLSSVTYTAGDGIDLASNVFSADVSDFAGTGLEDDGSNNLRIAAAAAGDGLTGGAGSALAVSAAALAGSGLENDGSNNLRIAAAAAGAGLTGGGGSALEIDQSAGHTWTGPWNFNNRIRWSNAFAQTLVGNTNNLAIGAVNVVRLIGGGFQLTGMVPDADDHLVWLQNASSTQNLVLKHDVTSTAANRFVLPGNVDHTLLPRAACWARYDGGTQRWFIAIG